jgi:hypothetical protein
MTESFRLEKTVIVFSSANLQTSNVMVRAGPEGVDDALRHRQLGKVEITSAPNHGEFVCNAQQ